MRHSDHFFTELNSGAALRLRGKGIAHSCDKRSDQVVTLKIMLPETITFYENINGAKVELAREMVVSTRYLVEASAEFYKTRSRPTCISWMDL